MADDVGRQDDLNKTQEFLDLEEELEIPLQSTICFVLKKSLSAKTMLFLPTVETFQCVLEYTSEEFE